MHTVTVDVERSTGTRPSTESARRWALGALALGADSAIAFGSIMLFATLSRLPDSDLAFHHAGDYWLAAIGLPTAASASMLLFALRALQPHARRQLTRAGATVLNTVALAVLFTILLCSVATGTEVRWGGAYPIATLVTFVRARAVRGRYVARWSVSHDPSSRCGQSSGCWAPSPPRAPHR